MQAFDSALKILTFFGFWKPSKWTTEWYGKLYDYVRIILIPLPYWLAFGQIFRILLETTNLDEMTETLFLMLTTINVCCKVTNILMCREKVSKLLKMLTLDLTKPQNKNEFVIYNGFDNIISNIVKIGFVMVEPTLLTGLVIPLFQSWSHRSLPCDVWLPYDYKASQLLYWSSYVMNSICAMSIGNLSIGIDVAINGFMLATSAQLELLTHRLVNLPSYITDGEKILNESSRLRRERYLLSQSVRHHIFIYEFAEQFMKTFSFSILSQFIVSSTAISVSVYQFTTDTSAASLAFYMKLLYLCTVVTQFFLFCWFGNELTYKSQELGRSVLEINWTTLSTKSVKSFLLISLRTTRPIVISSMYYVTFSLETFKSIMKVSYTAFNVLRDSSVNE